MNTSVISAVTRMPEIIAEHWTHEQSGQIKYIASNSLSLALICLIGALLIWELDLGPLVLDFGLEVAKSAGWTLLNLCICREIVCPFSVGLELINLLGNGTTTTTTTDSERINLPAIAIRLGRLPAVLASNERAQLSRLLAVKGGNNRKCGNKKISHERMRQRMCVFFSLSLSWIILAKKPCQKLSNANCRNIILDIPNKHYIILCIYLCIKLINDNHYYIEHQHHLLRVNFLLITIVTITIQHESARPKGHRPSTGFIISCWPLQSDG